MTPAAPERRTNLTRNADEQMIRFIDSGYDFLFAVPDGSNIVITHAAAKH